MNYWSESNGQLGTDVIGLPGGLDRCFYHFRVFMVHVEKESMSFWDKSESERLEHMRRHIIHKKPLRCGICLERFREPRDICLHLVEEHIRAECFDNDYFIVLYQSLMLHLLTHYPSARRQTSATVQSK